MAAALDHLLLGCADLRSGIDWLVARSGVGATEGGAHPAWGTHNALVSLGAREYLELLAPQPGPGPYRFPVDVRGCLTPRLVTWAVAVDDLDAALQALRAAGFSMADPRTGSRVRADGGRLEWRTAALLHEPARPDLDVLPFLIEWAPETTHPARAAPSGCALRTLTITHPDPAGVTRWLDGVGVAVRVQSGDTPALEACIDTPRGALRLSSAPAD